MLQIGLVLVFQGKPGWDIPLEYSLLGTNSIVWHVNTSQHSMKSWEPQGSSGRSASPCEFHLGDKTTFQGFPKSPFLQFGISARNSRRTLSSCWCCPSFSLCLPPFPAPSPSSGISTGSHPAFLLHPTTNPSRKKKRNGAREKNQLRIHQNPGQDTTSPGFPCFEQELFS